MLSDEEKILTKKLRYCEQEYEQDGYLSVGKFEAIKEAVNLIEKQSKEIEELKKYEKYYEEMEEVNKKFIAVDKIKEILGIEEKIEISSSIPRCKQFILENLG